MWEEIPGSASYTDNGALTALSGPSFQQQYDLQSLAPIPRTSYLFWRDL